MKPRCPKCRKSDSEPLGRNRRCLNCGAEFDPTDDGEVYTDPTRRLRRQEDRIEERRELKGGLN